jgi:anti-anti-sigma factor
MGEHIADFWRADRPEAACLMARGEIDLHVEDDFRDALADVITDGRSPAVLDLTGVTFFGSQGIAALIDSKVLAEERGVHLIVEPSAIVRRMLEVLRLDDEFALQSDN